MKKTLLFSETPASIMGSLLCQSGSTLEAIVFGVNGAFHRGR